MAATKKKKTKKKKEYEPTVGELREKLGDALWRLNNLYYIKDQNGNKVLFKTNEVQTDLRNNLWFFNIVPKARQLGITTFFSIFYLDQILFSKNRTATIIAHTEKDMKKIFRNKIKFAWDNLNPAIKAYIGEPKTDTANEMSFPNGGVISVALSSRSDTVQYLHISEFGKICRKYPEKAEEIVTGAINAVHAGNMVSIESTAEGREGYFYEFCMEAERLRKENRTLTEFDFKMFFYPWYVDPRYTLDADFIIEKKDQEYFDMLHRKHGITLTNGQKRWYVKKKATQRDKMFQEYPSTLEEAFQTSVEGSYYAKEMEKVYLENRMTIVPWDMTLPVDTYWDLGMNDFNVILLVQSKGRQIRFIDMYWSRGEPLAHYYNWLVKRKEEVGYRYGMNYFPHDVAVKELGTGVSRKETLYKLGMRNIKVGTKMPIVDGIDRVRTIFPQLWFDEEKCKKLADALFNYRKEFDHKLAMFKDKPRHDENSHFADPVRLLAQEWREYQPQLEGYKEQKNVSTSFFG